MRRRHLLTATCLSLPLASLAAPGAWAAYPDRPITMIVAYPPGGGTDAAARTLARFMSTASVPPPGGKATIMVIGRSG